MPRIHDWGRGLDVPSPQGRPSTTAVAILEHLDGREWVDLPELLEHGSYPAVMSAIFRLRRFGIVESHPKNRAPGEVAQYRLRK